MSTATMEKQDILKSKSTLVRRVSDLFRAEGNNSGSPLLLHHASMQKLRHCCQNLNLFPMLLYSFGQPKGPSMPMSKLNIALLIAKISERIYRVYATIRYTILRGFGLETTKQSVIAAANDKIAKSFITNTSTDSQRDANAKICPRRCERNFEKISLRKPKSHPMFLKLAIYLAPLLLAIQIIVIFSLAIFGKYSPGFIFLFAALIFLGCISMKVLSHDSTEVKTFKRDKRKND